MWGLFEYTESGAQRLIDHTLYMYVYVYVYILFVSAWLFACL